MQHLIDKGARDSVHAGHVGYGDTVINQVQNLTPIMSGEHRGSTPPNAAITSRTYAGRGALNDDRTFQLSHSAEYLQHEQAHSTTSIDGLSQRAKRRAAGLYLA